MKTEMNNKELNMVNGGYDKLYDTGVIDFSKVENCKVLGPASIKRERYKSQGELRLEQKLADMQRDELNNAELNQVNGGFKLGDAYEEDVYAAYGVKHESNWWSKDKYTLPDGTVTDYDGVEKYMKQCNAPTKKSKTPNCNPEPFKFL